VLSDPRSRLYRERRVSGVLGVAAFGRCPPLGEIRPGQAARADRAVVDETVLSVLNDLDHVVNGIAQDDPRFGPVCRKDELLEFAIDASRAESSEHLGEMFIAVVLGDPLGEIEQLGR
jgi:hypothetical protein